MCASAPARAAVKAAKNEPRWGSYAAARYALTRGATLTMWLTARRIETRRRMNHQFAGWLA